MFAEEEEAATRRPVSPKFSFSGAPPEEPPLEPPDEPPNLCCPITQVIFRDPVFVPEAGTTYERGAILTFWPRTFSAKEVLFLNEVEEILEQPRPRRSAPLLPHPTYSTHDTPDDTDDEGFWEDCEYSRLLAPGSLLLAGCGLEIGGNGLSGFGREGTDADLDIMTKWKWITMQID